MTPDPPQRWPGAKARVVILMYHGLYATEQERLAIDIADRPYAVSVNDFRGQLDAIAASGLTFIDPGRLTASLPPDGGVVLSFDDGHGSNHRHAAPELSRRDAAGIFFATSDFIGHRRGFCNMAQLREMAAAGHTIGAHGRTHRFIDAMSEADARSELTQSRAALEQGMGARVDQMSFPGGRYARAQLTWAHDAGYRRVYTSDVKTHRARTFALGTTLGRVAIRSGMTAAKVAAIARGDAAEMLPAQAAAAVKRSVRRAIGSTLYHALYERLAG